MFTMLSEDFYNIMPWERFIRKITMVTRARKTKTIDAKKYNFFFIIFKIKNTPLLDLTFLLNSI